MLALDSRRDLSERHPPAQLLYRLDSGLALRYFNQASVLPRTFDAVAERRAAASVPTATRLGPPAVSCSLQNAFPLELGDQCEHPKEQLCDAVVRDRVRTHIGHEHLAKYFGMAFPVEDLTPDRIREYARLRREGVIGGRAVRTSTIHRDLGMLKAALNWATTVYDGHRALLARNPLDRVKFPREKDPKRPVLDEETIVRLLESAPETHPYLRVLIVLARRTGRRLSAILNLHWDDVDFAKGMIRWRAEHDKVRRTWTVPMHPEVHDELLWFQKEQAAIGGALVFPHPQ